jgi:hypothetical protein
LVTIQFVAINKCSHCKNHSSSIDKDKQQYATLMRTASSPGRQNRMSIPGDKLHSKS